MNAGAQESQPLLGGTSRNDGLKGMRSRMAEHLESTTAHWTILLLVMIDFAMSLTQIILSLLLPPDYPNLLQTLTILSTISLVITILFALEIALHLSVFGYKYYLSPSYPHWFLHLLDAVVIIVTLVLEIVLGSEDGENSPEREVVGLLIILRLWRIIKILEAVAIGVGQYDEDRWVRRVHVLEEQNDHLRAQLEDERRLREDLEVQQGTQPSQASQ